MSWSGSTRRRPTIHASRKWSTLERGVGTIGLLQERAVHDTTDLTGRLRTRFEPVAERTLDVEALRANAITRSGRTSRQPGLDP